MQESQAANRVAERKQVLKPERLEFKSQLPRLLVVWLWASYLMRMSLDKVAKYYLPYSTVIEINEIIYIKHLVQCLAYSRCSLNKYDADNDKDSQWCL